MNLREAEEHLLGLELFGMRFGLDRMHRLMTALGMPQRRFASVHVVGTNGKSSTVRFLAAILRRHGLSTGSYTSPHLDSFRERIEIDEQPLEPGELGAAVSRAAHAAELVERTLDGDDRVTQFELLTAAAYHELARRGVDVAVVEAGLGGRCDATNVIPSRVQVLTGVGLEHTRWLGPTVDDIAGEKLAVVRDHSTLVAGALGPEPRAAAERVAAERHARLVFASGEASTALRALGSFQRENFSVAAAAAEAFLGRPLDPEAVADAGARTRIPGRLEVVGERPLTVIDGAHNPAGAHALAGSLPEVFGERRPRVGVISILDDKDAVGMLSVLLPAFDRLVLTRSAHPRALLPATLKSLVHQLDGPESETVGEPRRAVERARELAGSDGAVAATGSIYLVGDLVRREGAAKASSL